MQAAGQPQRLTLRKLRVWQEEKPIIELISRYGRMIYNCLRGNDNVSPSLDATVQFVVNDWKNE